MSSHFSQTIIISGRVQTVGYRFWTRKKASQLGLICEVENLKNGTVKATFQGPKEKVDQMIKLCWQGPPFAKVEKIKVLT